MELTAPYLALCLAKVFSQTQDLWPFPTQDISLYVGQKRSFYQHLSLPKSCHLSLEKPDWKTIETLLQWHAAPNCTLITPHMSLYPAQLRTINTPPDLLMVKGNPQYLSHPQCALVGSRNCSYYGISMAKHFATELSHSLIITSGLAVGIDSICHQSALHAAQPTIAVLGLDIDNAYHRRNHRLYRQIAEQGTLVSEVVPGTPYHKGMFPLRNRIIAGLSLGTIVIEARQHSGALITAQYALDEGRPVMTLPGPLRQHSCKGNLHLLKQGAHPLTCPKEVLEILSTPLAYSSSQTSTTFSSSTS